MNKITKNEKTKKIATLIVEATVKGMISSIPVAGNFLVEYLNLAQEIISNKRKDSWIAYVEDVLKNIPHSIEDLAKDEEFYSCLQIATQGALKSCKEEKLKLFANALYSSAYNTEMPIDKKTCLY